MASIASDIPKPLFKIEGVPVLEREIECLVNQGFDDIIITVSHLGNKIYEYFGDGQGISPTTGKPFGAKIEYFFEEMPLGNAGALFKMKDKLTEDFILVNADSIFDVDFDRFANYHIKNGGLATLFTHPNNHPYDSGLVITDDEGRVVKWLTKEDKRPQYYKNCVNAGIHILSPKLLEQDIQLPKIDLDRNLLKPLAGTGQMYAYRSPEYVRDMGTPDRYEAVSNDFSKGIVAAKNLNKKQKAIFLDRDGTINKYVGFLRKIGDFELLPEAAKAIKKINKSEYLAILVTNQPVIARGEVSIMQLNEIHNKMETLLGNEGAYLDDIYYCPHHPHKGYEGEIPELKIDCECRKPKAGMLLQAAREYNIDLSSSWMIGDSESDILAGRNAGCRTTIVMTGEKFEEGKEYGQTIKAKNLYDAINKILG